GRLIDPHGGLEDIDNKLLRHVSSAFVEDPLRVLRLARFKAKLHRLGFRVHETTIDLCKQMVGDGQLSELTAERVLMEMDKALATDSPAEFFGLLENIGAHRRLWPEITPHAVETLARRTDITDRESRFSLLFADCLPEAIGSLCRRLKCPRMRTEVTILVATLGATWNRLDDITADAVVDTLYRLDAFRKEERFLLFNRTCADIFDRRGARWPELRDLAASVKAADVHSAAAGEALGVAIRHEQIARIRDHRSND
ncbi:MAG: hypothetical protein MJA83_13405, partial [Gammaproteobacteria bacterium]|nr:hypothetical protein [Gammaproteobacteria bacterium]